MGEDDLTFSRRMGILPPRKAIQIDSMDKDLRTGLWNALNVFWEQYSPSSWGGFASEQFERFMDDLWLNHLKQPIDNRSTFYNDKYFIRKHFFECDWYRAYDFIEFAAQRYSDESLRATFIRVQLNTQAGVLGVPLRGRAVGQNHG